MSTYGTTTSSTLRVTIGLNFDPDPYRYERMANLLFTLSTVDGSTHIVEVSS